MQRIRGVRLLGVLGFVTALSAVVWTGCADGREAAEPGGGCANGATRECSCADGGKGSQSCVDGAFDACVCAPQPAADSGGPATPQCPSKDGGAIKKCQVCDFDRNATAGSCSAAPACANGSLGVPASPTAREDLALFNEKGTLIAPDAGAGPTFAPGTCLDAQLRMRVAKVKVRNAGGIAYCIVQASDGVTSEVALTPRSGDMKDNEEFPFPVEQGMFWGQSKPECTSNNLTLSYYCYRSTDNAAWTSALQAMGEVAADLGGTATPYGWAFGIAGAASQAAAAALEQAGQTDDERIAMQQTIPVDTLLDLTNGRQWTVRSVKARGFLQADSDWELTIESWGCAEQIASPR